MKIMRYIPLIALAILGFIIYGLYKTSSFVNKKVDSETLLAQDSLVQQALYSTSRATGSSPVNTGLPIVDSLATSATTIASPVTTTSTPDVAQPKASSQGKETTPNTATNTTSSSVATTLAKPVVPTKAITTAKTATEPSKVDVKKKAQVTAPVTKTAVDKAAATTGTQTVVAKNEIPKSASTTGKTDIAETRFHVIIGSYKNESNAKAKASEFNQKNNKKANIVKQGGYFRVSADDFEFSQAAAQYAQKLKEAGEDNIILKF